MVQEKIRVKTSKPYDVHIGTGLLGEAGGIIKPLVAGKKIAVITDDTVDAFYSGILTAGLEAEGFSVVKFVFPAGEKSKCFSTYYDILNFLAENQLTRHDAVVALGGGVTGDISGFAASTYLRGIRYIQVPTTLLAAVDSSVGGKCAIDLPEGKNLVGTFCQPETVICDTDTFDTLPEDVFFDGCGEVMKYGILRSPGIIKHLTERSLNLDRRYIVSECVGIKADIVSNDEFERGERALLNLGHTVGHAIEKLSGYTVSHGSAISTGCAVIARASYEAGFCDAETVRTVSECVSSIHHPLTTEYSPEELSRAMLHDKKRNGDAIRFIVIRSVGECMMHNISISDVEGFIKKGV